MLKNKLVSMSAMLIAVGAALFASSTSGVALIVLAIIGSHAIVVFIYDIVASIFPGFPRINSRDIFPFIPL
jgi:hypothetical protein